MFLEQLINGITLGSIYAIVALGYTLVFGVLGIINMAHGEIFMFGAFVGLLIVSKAGAPLPVAFLGAIVVTASMGLLLDEPTLGLAPLVVADIFAIIREINAAGTTILVVEQNVRQALKVSSYAYVLETGKIALS